MRLVLEPDQWLEPGQWPKDGPREGPGDRLCIHVGRVGEAAVKCAGHWWVLVDGYRELGAGVHWGVRLLVRADTLPVDVQPEVTR